MKSDCNYERDDLIATWVKGHLCSTPDMHMDMDSACSSYSMFMSCRYLHTSWKLNGPNLAIPLEIMRAVLPAVQTRPEIHIN